MRATAAGGSGPQCWGSLRRRDGQRPNAAGFVCGAMAVCHRAGRVFCVANRGTGACPTRAQRDAPARSLPTTVHERALGRSPQASGPMAHDLALVCCKVRAGQRRRGLPTNWQLCSATKRIRPTARARTRGLRIRSRRGRRGPSLRGAWAALGGCPITGDGCHLRQGRDPGRVPQRSRGRSQNRQPQAQFFNICGHRVGVRRRRHQPCEGPGEARAISASRGAFTPSTRPLSL